MIRKAACLFLSFATPLVAEDIPLSMPIDCTLGDSCYIQNYVDHDPGEGFSDFTCGSLGYDGHKGTDFALPDLAAMARGVDVLAAAPGVVRGVRDGMIDRSIRAPDAPDVAGRECGNGLVLDHGDGWHTQYCHMKNGSLTVQKGQRVAKGAVLGQVGLSGRTEFPHLHLSLRHRGEIIDPFQTAGTDRCGAPGPTLWDDPIAYVSGGVIEAGFLDRVPEFDEVKAGNLAAETLPRTAAGLVLWGYFFGVRQGDVITIELAGPEGFHSKTSTLIKRNRALSFRASGKKRPGASWPLGCYSGTVTLTRAGQPLDVRAASVEVTSR